MWCCKITRRPDGLISQFTFQTTLCCYGEERCDAQQYLPLVRLLQTCHCTQQHLSSCRNGSLRLLKAGSVCHSSCHGVAAAQWTQSPLSAMKAAASTPSEPCLTLNTQTLDSETLIEAEILFTGTWAKQSYLCPKDSLIFEIQPSKITREAELCGWSSSWINPSS